MVRRWCIFDSTVDPFEFNRRFLVAAVNKATLIGGKIVAEVEFRDHERLRRFQAQVGVAVLPGLETPQRAVSQTTKGWLTSQGVVIDPTDRVLNLLRKLRNAKGIAVDQLDISTSE